MEYGRVGCGCCKQSFLHNEYKNRQDCFNRDGERFSTRYYRNKRRGELLKELDLTEGKSTGVPTIQEELRKIGSPKAKFTTDMDRRAVTVEIPIHPAFLENEAESVVSNEKVMFESGKSVVSDEKVSFETEKSVVSDEKVSFESGKSVLEALLLVMPCTEKTRNNIRQLFKLLGTDVFSRADVMRILGLSGTAAGKLLNVMKQNNLIEPVEGHGKGRYRFL